MTETEARLILRGPLGFGDPKQIAAVNCIVQAETRKEEGEDEECESGG